MNVTLARELSQSSKVASRRSRVDVLHITVIDMVADALTSLTLQPGMLDLTARTIGPLRFRLSANSVWPVQLIFDIHLLNISKAAVPLQAFKDNGSKLYLPSWKFLTALVTILLSLKL